MTIYAWIFLVRAAYFISDFHISAVAKQLPTTKCPSLCDSGLLWNVYDSWWRSNSSESIHITFAIYTATFPYVFATQRNRAGCHPPLLDLSLVICSVYSGFVFECPVLYNSVYSFFFVGVCA